MRYIGLAGVLISLVLLGGCMWIIGTPTMVTDLAVEAVVNPGRPSIGSAVDAAGDGSRPVTETLPGSGSEITVEEAGPDGVFEDDNISATWGLTGRWFVLILHNRTDDPLHIVWEEALIAGESHWERLANPPRMLPLEPTVVDPRSFVRCWAAPLSTLIWHDTRTGGFWRCDEDGPLGTACYKRQSKAKVRRLAKNAVGHRFRVLLPLEIEGKKIDYLFTITVSAAKAKTFYS